MLCQYVKLKKKKKTPPLVFFFSFTKTSKFVTIQSLNSHPETKKKERL